VTLQTPFPSKEMDAVTTINEEIATICEMRSEVETQIEGLERTLERLNVLESAFEIAVSRVDKQGELPLTVDLTIS
jgi:hypothetical protein